MNLFALERLSSRLRKRADADLALVRSNTHMDDPRYVLVRYSTLQTIVEEIDAVVREERGQETATRLHEMDLPIEVNLRKTRRKKK